MQHLKINGRLYHPDHIQQASFTQQYPHDGPHYHQPLLTMIINGVQVDEFGPDAETAWNALQPKVESDTDTLKGLIRGALAEALAGAMQQAKPAPEQTKPAPYIGPARPA